MSNCIDVTQDKLRIGKVEIGEDHLDAGVRVIYPAVGVLEGVLEQRSEMPEHMPTETTLDGWDLSVWISNAMHNLKSLSDPGLIENNKVYPGRYRIILEKIGD